MTTDLPKVLAIGSVFIIGRIRGSARPHRRRLVRQEVVGEVGGQLRQERRPYLGWAGQSPGAANGGSGISG